MVNIILYIVACIFVLLKMLLVLAFTHRVMAVKLHSVMGSNVS